MGSTTSEIRVPFTKMAGAGNDFIMVNSVKNPVHLDWQAFAIRSCALKTGIGADGVIVLGEDTDTDFTLRIFNADGSEAQMCGNGLRCASKFAYERGLLTGHLFDPPEQMSRVLEKFGLLLEREVVYLPEDMAG